MKINTPELWFAINSGIILCKILNLSWQDVFLTHIISGITLILLDYILDNFRIVKIDKERP